MWQKKKLFKILLSIISNISLFFVIFVLFFTSIKSFHHFNDDNSNSADNITLANFGREEFSFQERHYIIFSVNSGEGFNLRRDVYLRVANIVRQLREQNYNYVLVLPPWGPIFHWQHDGQPFKMRQPWRNFFNLKSLSKFVPVIEFEDFLTENRNIDLVLYLQHYAEGWNSDEGYQVKYDERACEDAYNFYHLKNGKIKAAFFGYGNSVNANNLSCLSIQGQSSTLANAIIKNYLKPAETILHDNFGDYYYWKARRSMRYANHLIEIGNKFRKEVLNSTDKLDKIQTLTENWEEDEHKRRENAGGNYLCLHWRRTDFLRAHHKHLPSIKGTAIQIIKLCQQLNLTNVFLSTDTFVDEITNLANFLAQKSIYLFYFKTKDMDVEVSEGEISIIDQWICAHAKYFIGTHLSTFSFRIHEDREILGFLSSSTFNRLCPDENLIELNLENSDNRKNNELCEQPAKWTIVFK